MSIRTIAILSPGDMGHAVGGALHQHGHDVITCLEGRGPESCARAARAGFRAVANLETLAAEADLFLSILPPEFAEDTAERIAGAMRAVGTAPPYADCNAVSPQTTVKVGRIVTAAGARFIDTGIVGSPPGGGSLPTRFFVSGPDAAIMAVLDGKGIAVRQCGGRIGDASAVKMCYAAVSKGTNALHAAALTAAEALGVGELVREEMGHSAASVYERMRRNIPRLPADSGRWIFEMEEIAATFESCGVTPHFHEGAADIYRLMVATPLAQESRETIDPDRTMEETIKVFLDRLGERKAAE